MALKSELMAAGMPAAQANRLGFDPLATASAAGTTQGGATVLVSNFTNVTVTAANSGVMVASMEQVSAIFNSGVSTLTVYPKSGGTIIGQSKNAGISVPTGKSIILTPAGLNMMPNVSA